MITFDPVTIYTTEEVQDMLRGFVKIETLRSFGLVSLPGTGYWGANLIEAINVMQRCRRNQKVPDKPSNLETDGTITSGCVELKRAGLKRKTTVFHQPVANQTKKLKDLAENR